MPCQKTTTVRFYKLSCGIFHDAVLPNALFVIIERVTNTSWLKVSNIPDAPLPLVTKLSRYFDDHNNTIAG